MSTLNPKQAAELIRRRQAGIDLGTESLSPREIEMIADALEAKDADATPPTQLVVDLNPFIADSFMGHVVTAAADQLLRVYSYGPNGEEGSRSSELERKLRNHIDEQLAEVVRENVATHVQALLEMPLPAMDRFGSPRPGASSTLAERIHEQIHKELTTSRRGSSSVSGGLSVLDEAISKQVKRELSGELSGELAQAKMALREEITKTAAEVLAKTVEKAVGL